MFLENIEFFYTKTKESFKKFRKFRRFFRKYRIFLYKNYGKF